MYLLLTLICTLSAVSLSISQFLNPYEKAQRHRYQKCHDKNNLTSISFNKLAKCWSLMESIGILQDIYPQVPPTPVAFTSPSPFLPYNYTFSPFAHNTTTVANGSQISNNFTTISNRRAPATTTSRRTRRPPPTRTVTTTRMPSTTSADPGLNDFIEEMFDTEVCKIFMPIVLMVTKGEMEKVCCDTYCYCQSLLSDDKDFCGKALRA